MTMTTPGCPASEVLFEMARIVIDEEAAPRRVRAR